VGITGERPVQEVDDGGDRCRKVRSESRVAAADWTTV